MTFNQLSPCAHFSAVVGSDRISVLFAAVLGLVVNVLAANGRKWEKHVGSGRACII